MRMDGVNRDVLEKLRFGENDVVYPTEHVPNHPSTISKSKHLIRPTIAL